MDYSVVEQERADMLRHEFVEKYTDKTLPFYQKTLRMRQFFDGMCYMGYIWEVLKKPYDMITREAALTLLGNKAEVYVMWDIRTMKNVAQKFQYKVPKDRVIRTDGQSLAEQLRVDFASLAEPVSFLPEDIYVFDDSLSWFIAFTHEPDERGDIMCMTNLS